MKDTKQKEPIWIRVESAGVDLSVLRNSLHIGQLVLEDNGKAILEEFNDFIYLLMDYSKKIEAEIDDITECLRAEYAAQNTQEVV